MNLQDYKREVYKANSIIKFHGKESISHNYGINYLEEVKHFYANGILLTYTYCEKEPFYRESDDTFPRNFRADLLFKCNGKTYLLEFIVSNKNIQHKINMCKQYGICLITVNMNYFYKDKKLTAYRNNGMIYQWLDELDRQLRIIMQNPNNGKIVEVYA